MSKLSSSVSSIITTFLIFTTLFFLLKGYLMKGQGPDSDSSVSAAATLGYLILIIVVQLFFNFSNAQAVCNGSSQNLFTVLMYTFIPNFLILGSVVTFAAI